MVQERIAFPFPLFLLRESLFGDDLVLYCFVSKTVCVPEWNLLVCLRVRRMMTRAACLSVGHP